MADYCPHCERPYDEDAVTWERDGLSLCVDKLSYGGKTIKIPLRQQQMMAVLLRKGRMSHELIGFMLDNDTDDARNLASVFMYQCRQSLKKLGAPFTIVIEYKIGYALEKLS